MFTLTPGKTTGKQAVAIVKEAVKMRRQKTCKNTCVNDFLRASSLSKQMLHRYSRGEKPGEVGLCKIERGLKKWGISVIIFHI